MDSMFDEVRSPSYASPPVGPTTYEGISVNGQHEVKSMYPKLYEAANSGNLQDLLGLLSLPKETTDTDILLQVTPMEDTTLHIAARQGHLEFAREVYRRCPSLLKKTNSNGDTSLIVATRAGHLQVVRFLIDCSSSSLASRDAREFLSKRNIEGNTAMHEAVQNGHLELVKLLIREVTELMSNYAGESALYVAVERSTLDMVKEILRSNAPYYCICPSDPTAMHAAVRRNDTVIAELLLEKNKKLVSKADSDKKTPLHFAVKLQHHKMVELLLECNTSVAYHLDRNGFAPIHVAAANGYVPILKELLRCCPDLKELHHYRKGQNILHIAVACGEHQLVLYILKTLELEGLINEKDKGGNTPLHQATISGYPYIVNILLRDGRVDVKELNRQRLTALEIAKSVAYESPDDRAMRLILANLLHYAHGSWLDSVEGVMEFAFLNLKRQKPPSEIYKAKGSILIVVAALVATVTFAAGFTLPGGYQNDGEKQGLATLVKHERFEAFVLWDASAMYLSIVAVITIILMHSTSSSWFTLLKEVFLMQIIAMSVAFVVGLRLTVAESKMLTYYLMKICSTTYSLCVIFLLYVFMRVPVVYDMLFLTNRYSIYFLSRYIY